MFHYDDDDEGDNAAAAAAADDDDDEDDIIITWSSNVVQDICLPGQPPFTKSADILRTDVYMLQQIHEARKFTNFLKNKGHLIHRFPKGFRKHSGNM